MTDDLQARADSATQSGVSSTQTGSETARIILTAAEGQTAESAASLAQNAGARVHQQLDALGLVVADVPVSKLSELAARDEVSWLSSDQPVRSMATSYDNTSHQEVTTGASKILPLGNNALASGGGGSGVGIAILDSGISPPDSAEFAGYKWCQSSGTLGTGLFSQTYLCSYPRILKHVDFTGEGTTEDKYGHGTHTAGVAAGTGQSSEDYAASNPGSPTYGGIATNANLVDVRVLNSYGVGTV
jgi:serine protease AprX